MFLYSCKIKTIHYPYNHSLINYIITVARLNFHKEGYLDSILLIFMDKIRKKYLNKEPVPCLMIEKEPPIN